MLAGMTKFARMFIGYKLLLILLSLIRLPDWAQ